MWITAGANKNYRKWFFVLRMDGKSGNCFLDKPRLPNLKNIILTNTKENAVVFRSDNPDEPKFAEQLPKFKRYRVRSDSFHDELLPQGQFVVDYAQLEWNGSSRNGSTDERGLTYHLYFETKDWLQFNLLKIVRTGAAPSDAIEQDTVPNTPVILYLRKSK